MALFATAAGCDPIAELKPFGQGPTGAGAAAWAGSGSIGGSLANPELAGRSGGGGAASTTCERELRFMAVELDEHPPFDVLIVADHSDSLSWSRDDLAAGLRSLLSAVHGHTARFFVLTPTQYGATTSAAIHPASGDELVPWRDAVTGEPFANAMTAYTQTCSDPEGVAIDCPAYDPTVRAPLYTLTGEFDFLMPEPVATITPAMSADEIALQQQAVSDAILNLGGGGSPREQPLCTLNRYLLQNPKPLPERAVFVVLSDEDDTSLPEECLAGFQYERVLIDRPKGALCMTGCASYQYYAYRPILLQRVEFTCVPLDDTGTPHPERGFASNSFLTEDSGSSCTAVGPSTCGIAGVARAEQTCGAGHVVQNCSATCQEGQQSGCMLETATDTTDYCAGPFRHQGVDYPSFEAYCDATAGDFAWLQCQHIGFMEAAVEGSSEQRTSVVSGRTAADMITSFRQQAARAFGANGFLVEVIGFDPAFACVPGPGQSHATQLRTLATSPSDVFPICGDYAQALEGVERFAHRLLQTELELGLKSSETIASVRVVGENGVERVLGATSYRYDAVTGILHIESAALTPSDVALSVEVDDRCKGKVD